MAGGSVESPSAAQSGSGCGWRIKAIVATLSALGLLYVQQVLLQAGDGKTLVSQLAQLAVFAAFLLAFTNGANDIANSVGTSVGAGAMSLQTAVIAGCACEFAGGIIVGPLVSETLSHGVIDLASFEKTPAVLVKIMFCSILGSALSTLGATCYGVPVSATKGVIVSMIVLTLTIKGEDALEWSGLRIMGATFLISPLSGMLGAYCLNTFLLRSVVLADDPPARARALRPPLVALTVAVSSLSLTLAGPMALTPASHALLLSAAIGCLVTFFWPAIISICRSDDDAAQELNDAGSTDESDQESRAKLVSPSRGARRDSRAHSPVELKVVSDSASGEPAQGQTAVNSEVDRLFEPLVIFSGLVIAFAHGSNDVSNAAGPLGIIVGFAADPDTASIATVQRPWWTNAMAACAFVSGIILIGGRTIQLVGVKLARQTATKAYATQFGAASTILVCSLLKQTVSTSHVLVGAVVGASTAEAHNLRNAPPVNYGVLMKIVIGWVVTIPIAGGIAWCCFYAVNIASGQW